MKAAHFLPISASALAIAISFSGCDAGPSAEELAVQEAKVLASLGDAEVRSWEVAAGGGSDAELEEAGVVMQALREAPQTVSAMIDACRRSPGGKPCTFDLAPAEVADLEAAFGVPRSTSDKTHTTADGSVFCDTYTYGNLTLGVSDGYVRFVEVLE